MDPNLRPRRRPVPSGPREQQSQAQMSPAMPSTQTSAPRQPEMIQRTGSKSAISPGRTVRMAQSLESQAESQQPRMPMDQPRHPPSPSRTRDYPHAPPPARHRSRSPANSPPPSSDITGQAMQSSDLPSERARSRGDASSTSRQPPAAAPFQSAHVHTHSLHHQERRDPHRLLPTPVRAPRAITFELAPSTTEFIYTSQPPLTTSDGHTNNGEQTSNFQPIPRAVPGTLRVVSPADLALVYSNPSYFSDQQHRIPEDISEDPQAREPFTAPFLYESGVDYQSAVGMDPEVEIPSSPPVFDQFAAFEHARGLGMIREVEENGHVSEDQMAGHGYGEVFESSEVLEMPGMWR